MSIIYRKTAKGLAELETRVYRLAPRLRSVLIMIDGKRSDGELMALVPQAGEALAALVQEGFISEYTRPGTVVPPAAAPPAAGERTVIRGQKPSFEAMRRNLLRAFDEYAGPAGEALAQKLEAARSETEFRALLPAAVQLVAALKGRPAADAFTARIEAW
jgi:hypothetical protein